jgi:hypothetical protein
MPFERRPRAAADREVSPKTRTLKRPARASTAHMTPRSSASERVAVGPVGRDRLGQPAGARRPSIRHRATWCIREQQRRRADCSYPCDSDTARVTSPHYRCAPPFCLHASAAEFRRRTLAAISGVCSRNGTARPDKDEERWAHEETDEDEGPDLGRTERQRSGEADLGADLLDPLRRRVRLVSGATAAVRKSSWGSLLGERVCQ